MSEKSGRDSSGWASCGLVPLAILVPAEARRGWWLVVGGMWPVFHRHGFHPGL